MTIRSKSQGQSSLSRQSSVLRLKIKEVAQRMKKRILQNKILIILARVKKKKKQARVIMRVHLS